MYYNEKLQTVLSDLCTEYHLPIPKLEISKRLKAVNGRFEVFYDTTKFLDAKTPTEVLKSLNKVTIKISAHMFEHFGYERAEQTLRHEIAHYVDLIYNCNKNFGHEEAFKSICEMLCGSMNPTMAGVKYATCASLDFVSKKIGYDYKCPCGAGKYHTTRKIQKKVINRYHCKSCGKTIAEWDMVAL